MVSVSVLKKLSSISSAAEVGESTTVLSVITSC
jgi:hypothetical protein